MCSSTGMLQNGESLADVPANYDTLAEGIALSRIGSFSFVMVNGSKCSPVKFD